MKLGLLQDMPVLRTNGASAAGTAPDGDTVCASRIGDMPRAGRHIETYWREGVHRAGRQTRLVQAAVAGTGPPIRLRQVDLLREGQRAAISVPQAPVGVDQDAERGRIDRLGLLCPALEGQEGRAAEGEERGGAERR